MTAALEGGEWSAARPGRTLPPGKIRYPLYRMGHRAGLDRRKICPHQDSIPDRPARSSVAIPTELPAPQRVENCFDYTKVAAWRATLFVKDLSAFCSLLSTVLFSVSTLHHFTNIGIIDRINDFKDKA